jgi:hypothetical protein
VFCLISLCSPVRLLWDCITSANITPSCLTYISVLTVFKNHGFLNLGNLRKFKCASSKRMERCYNSLEHTVQGFEESVKPTYIWPVDSTRTVDGILCSHTIVSPFLRILSGDLKCFIMCPKFIFDTVKDFASLRGAIKTDRNFKSMLVSH